MENLDYNNENIERKYLGKNQFFKLKNSLSDLELFYKPIIVCEDDMDKFEKQVLMKSLSHLI